MGRPRRGAGRVRRVRIPAAPRIARRRARAGRRDAPTARGVAGVVTGDLPVANGCYETHPAATVTSDITPVPKPCDGLHNTYVVAHVPYPDPPDTAYDQQAVVDEGRTLCQARDDAYVGRATARFTYVSIYPAEDDWAAGDRTAVCMVRREGPDVVGPLTQ